MTCAPLYAEDLSIKISLGIRDNDKLFEEGEKGIAKYPLAFRIENTSKMLIDKHTIPNLFFQGTIHVLTKEGKEEKTKFQTMWRTTIYDLQPGATFESPVYGDLLAFFASLKDGDYQVWWTLRELTSNTLRVTVTNGKVTRTYSEI
jgi:hypothetical protein